MKVYIVIRNEFCIHEYDNYFNEAVYLDENKAQEFCDFSNKNMGNGSKYSGISFYVEVYETKE